VRGGWTGAPPPFHPEINRMPEPLGAPLGLARRATAASWFVSVQSSKSEDCGRTESIGHCFGARGHPKNGQSDPCAASAVAVMLTGQIWTLSGSSESRSVPIRLSSVWRRNPTVSGFSAYAPRLSRLTAGCSLT
jgi:hypothetical protein